MAAIREVALRVVTHARPRHGRCERDARSAQLSRGVRARRRGVAWRPAQRQRTLRQRACRHARAAAIARRVCPPIARAAAPPLRGAHQMGVFSTCSPRAARSIRSLEGTALGVEAAAPAAGAAAAHTGAARRPARPRAAGTDAVSAGCCAVNAMMATASGAARVLQSGLVWLNIKQNNKNKA
jgi:hypothetical protein